MFKVAAMFAWLLGLCGALRTTARWLGLVAVRVRVGMCFCIVPIDGDELAVTIK